MKFSDIPAHDDVKEQLRAMVDNNRIPHALLLEGRSGIGKFMLARALAQYIHCTNRTNGDACGCCPSCLQHQSHNHIDTCFSYPVIKNSSSHAVSDDYAAQWHEFLDESPYMEFPLWQEMLGKADAQPLIYVDESAEILRRLSFTAHAARYMIVLMWLPERMKEECANKLLKIIEEPHDDTVFILVSNDSSKILPTIYSRLRRVEMKRLPEAAVEEWLVENRGVDPDMASGIAHLSEGSISEAIRRLSVADDTQAMFDLFVSLMRLAYQRNVHALRDWAESVSKLGREKSIKFTEYCERLVGENYIYNLHNPSLVYLDRSEENFSRNFARFINERNVQQLRDLFVDARRDIAGNAASKIVMFDVALKTIMLLRK